MSDAIPPSSFRNGNDLENLLDSVEPPWRGLHGIAMVHIVLLQVGAVILHGSAEKGGRKTYLG